MIRGELRMNNHCVPDFEMDEDFNLPTFSTRPRKPSLPEDEVVELLWQNGQVIMQSQNQRSFRKLVEEEEEVHNLFVQEDEMASWLNYPDPTLDHNFCTEILYPNPTHTPTPAMTTTTTVNLSVRPPILPGRRVETTVVGSSETPEFRVLEMAKRRAVAASNGDVPCEIRRGAGGVEEKEKEIENENVNCEMTVTSMSPGGSSASAEPPAPKPIANDRKRKGRALDDTECQSEDIEYESTDAKKRLRGSTSTKRSRAAEVHNLSERRRRDRINEKMKALQELIPRCNKTDKASMLDEAIEYLKTLQLQVQMMSMGCGMVPMMFSGVQQYMPSPMGMGIGMGMGMGMEMGMNRPMMQFPNLLAGSTLPMQAGTAHLGPRFPLPNFAMPPVPVSDPSRIQTPNLANQMLNSFNTQNTTQPMVSSLLDSYHQFLSSNHIQFPVTQAPLQNQPLVQSNTSRPCTSRGPENPKSHQPG